MSSYKVINPYTNEPIADVTYTSRDEAMSAIALLERKTHTKEFCAL